MSLDGFIADADGGYAWIPMDDEIDFDAFLSKIDGLVMGRGTWEVLVAEPETRAAFASMDIFVVSTTLDPETVPDVTVIGEDVAGRIAELKAGPGKDLWLFGGGVLFRSLLEAGLVDRVEVALIPALLGSGVPLLPGSDAPAVLEFHSMETFPSGIALAKYDVAAASSGGD